MSDTLGTLIMIGGAVALMHTMYGSTGAKMTATVGGGVSAEHEIDPTRWRHDGRQPMARRNGNGPLNDNYTVQRLYDMI